ncbi:chaperonin 10-like protein [Aspergillus pseudoustus]|uniref:Chaperonin 10-like protein n=1 Tax=Aspergillus pseudoustus TaxID=1810923 RepID=A0ABR4ING7_9EURO
MPFLMVAAQTAIDETSKVITVEKTPEVRLEQINPHPETGNDAVRPPQENPMQCALLINAACEYKLTMSFPVPTSLHSNEVMIRNYATGLNPIDWKSLAYNFCLPQFPWITGREMAGIVARVGDAVTNCRVGDRVWTSTYYKDRRAGCFQDLVVVPEHTVARIPAGLDFESAACLGVGALTAAMTLWKWMGIPMYPPPAVPSTVARDDRGYVLIWGGSSVTGQFATQLAALAHLHVIAVCSGQAAPVLRQLGAKHIVVRDGLSDAEIADAIRGIAGDDITRGIDLVGSKTARTLLEVLSKSKPALLAPLAMMSSSTPVPDNVTVVGVEMKQFVLDPSSKVYSSRLNELIEDGHIQLPQIEVIKGGLAAVEGGLRRLKEGRANGKKLVVSFT